MGRDPRAGVDAGHLRTHHLRSRRAVDIHPAALTTPSEAARLFGLNDWPEIYAEVGRQEAAAVLIAVMTRDMAYNTPLVALPDALQLAADFLDAHGEHARYYTNGYYGKSRVTGTSWYPATEHTFDTGVLIIAPEQVGCAWFMDED